MPNYRNTFKNTTKYLDSQEGLKEQLKAFFNDIDWASLNVSVTGRQDNIKDFIQFVRDTSAQMTELWSQEHKEEKKTQYATLLNFLKAYDNQETAAAIIQIAKKRNVDTVKKLAKEALDIEPSNKVLSDAIEGLLIEKNNSATAPLYGEDMVFADDKENLLALQTAVLHANDEDLIEFIASRDPLLQVIKTEKLTVDDQKKLLQEALSKASEKKLAMISRYYQVSSIKKAFTKIDITQTSENLKLFNSLVSFLEESNSAAKYSTFIENVRKIRNLLKEKKDNPNEIIQDKMMLLIEALKNDLLIVTSDALEAILNGFGLPNTTIEQDISSSTDVALTDIVSAISPYLQKDQDLEKADFTTAVNKVKLMSMVETYKKKLLETFKSSTKENARSKIISLIRYGDVGMTRDDYLKMIYHIRALPSVSKDQSNKVDKLLGNFTKESSDMETIDTKFNRGLASASSWNAISADKDRRPWYLSDRVKYGDKIKGVMPAFIDKYVTLCLDIMYKPADMVVLSQISDFIKHASDGSAVNFESMKKNLYTSLSVSMAQYVGKFILASPVLAISLIYCPIGLIASAGYAVASLFNKDFSTELRASAKDYFASAFKPFYFAVINPVINMIKISAPLRAVSVVAYDAAFVWPTKKMSSEDETLTTIKIINNNPKFKDMDNILKYYVKLHASNDGNKDNLPDSVAKALQNYVSNALDSMNQKNINNITGTVLLSQSKANSLAKVIEEELQSLSLNDKQRINCQNLLQVLHSKGVTVNEGLLAEKSSRMMFSARFSQAFNNSFNGSFRSKASITPSSETASSFEETPSSSRTSSDSASLENTTSSQSGDLPPIELPKQPSTTKLNKP